MASKAKTVRRRRGPVYGDEWLVFVEYKGGPDERDEVCSLLVGRRSAGSGYDYTRDVRDLNWEMTERRARNAAELLLWVRGVKVRIRGPVDVTPKKPGRTRTKGKPSR
jgi:hypothetical protein